MGVRRPIVAGSFYESGFQALEEQIKNSFLHKKGPGDLPTKRKEKQIKAVICPHAGYFFSGPCAAWGYKEIAESKMPDLYIILGPNHTGLGKTSVNLDSWQTPFGMVRTDQEFGRTLIKNTKLIEDPRAHMQEHSIEVQLPFLQFVSKDMLQNLRFLPITISDDVDIARLALDIKEVILDTNKKVVFIVSSDFTHYGPQYGYVPFSSEVPERMYKLDQGAIKLIKNLDADGLLKYNYETGATICGQLPIALLLKTLEKTKGKLLQYYTSADIVGSYKNAVGYASILFE